MWLEIVKEKTILWSRFENLREADPCSDSLTTFRAEGRKIYLLHYLDKLPI